jgi:hypothetical protein
MDKIISSALREGFFETYIRITKYIDINTKYLYNSLKLLPKEIENDMNFKITILNQRIDSVYELMVEMNSKIEDIYEELKK